MCKYCYFKENGDCGDDWTIIGEDVVKVPTTYTLEEKARKLCRTFYDEIPVFIQLDVHPKSWNSDDFCLGLSAEIDGNMGSDDEYVPNEIYFPINFCPMCGEKLRK